MVIVREKGNYKGSNPTVKENQQYNYKVFHNLGVPKITIIYGQQNMLLNQILMKSVITRSILIKLYTYINLGQLPCKLHSSNLVYKYFLYVYISFDTSLITLDMIQ